VHHQMSKALDLWKDGHYSDAIGRFRKVLEASLYRILDHLDERFRKGDDGLAELPSIRRALIEKKEASSILSTSYTIR